MTMIVVEEKRMKPSKMPPVRQAKIPVSDSNIAKAAIRLLSQKLVSSEVHYVRQTLGNFASQTDLDEQVLAVRKLPWAAIVVSE